MHGFPGGKKDAKHLLKIKERGDDMPHIQVNATCPIDREQEQQLIAQIGDAISLLPGMKAEYLMIRLEDDCRLFFGGTGSCAFVEIDRFGRIPEEASQALTERLSDILERVLDISRDRMYLKYTENPYWGCHGHNF